MIPLEKVKQIVSTYETLEKELASGDIKKKDFAQKSKRYSSIREVINQARSYLIFEQEKTELEKIIEDKKSDKDMIELAKNELIQLSCHLPLYGEVNQTGTSCDHLFLRQLILSVFVKLLLGH